MTNNYTDIFGGTAVSASNPSYSTVTLSANTTYTWPGTIDGSNPLADIMNVTATVGSLKFIMPPGNQGSTGSSVLFVNKGANSFQVVANDGVTAIVTITAGQGVYVYLTDNSTANGTFNTVGLGTGTSSPDAASLAGFGLMVTATTLNTAHTVSVQSANYAVISSDRAELITWTGGAGSFTMSPASTMGNNFFYLASNQGTGALSIIPTAPDSIDGATPSIALNPGESCFVICSGTTWYTVGRGRSNSFAYSILSKNVAGSSDVTLTTAEAANLIHTYFGALTGSINVILPTVIQQYTIYNNTTGAFNLTVKTAAGTGFTIVQGYRVIVYCDGTNILSSSTLATGTVSSVGITPPSAGITVSGSPVTTSGSITLALANDLAALEGLTTTGYARRTGTSTWTASPDVAAANLSASGTATFTGGLGTVGIGSTSATSFLYLGANATGATTIFGVFAQHAVQTDVTAFYDAFRAGPSVAASTTLTNLRGYVFTNPSLGAGASVTTLKAFESAAITSGTTSYAFYAASTSAAGRWNFFADGTANNAFGGNTRFGGTTAPTVAVDVTGSLAVSGSTVSRIDPRITNVASSATPIPNVSTTDQYNLTALAATATFGIPTGTPLDGNKLIIRIKDNGVARTLAWNAIYRAVGITLPTTTVISKTLYVGFIYNGADAKWDAVALNQEA